MRPLLIIDNALRQPAVINFMRAITASTLAEDTPPDMMVMLDLLAMTPANTPGNPPAAPKNTARFV